MGNNGIHLVHEEKYNIVSVLCDNIGTGIVVSLCMIKEGVGSLDNNM